MYFCQYLYFLDKGFNFQPDISNGFQDILIMSKNLNNIVILNICGVDYCRIFNGISKSEAINLLKNVELNNKNGTL